VVAGITRPDAGSVEVAAPISAILELGLGFHPEFSGRENALLYGAVIGVPERVMRERLADVLAFAELGEFIDQPLRTYSSGMTARLAFAVATHVDPNVLLVDEALAVGDIAFQKKCVDRMARFLADRRTVLFCSHAMYLVTSFCQRAVWLRDGQVAAAGDVHAVVSAYEEYLVTRGSTCSTATTGRSSSSLPTAG
jgi:ABC-type polysaccharide/polyol phosphate transport system ATPase subunit